MTDDELEAEMVQRATAAGEAAGVYLETAMLVREVRDGSVAAVRPLQLVVRYRIGDRAWLPPVDVAAIEARQREVRQLEDAYGGIDVERLRREAQAGPLGRLEREAGA